MCRSCDLLIDGVWKNLTTKKKFQTPDEVRGSSYTVTEIDKLKIKISPQNIQITKKAFSATIHYLKKKRIDRDHPIRIQSSNDPTMAGPLCTISRGKNNGVRCINYILPILHKFRIVGIDSTRPNKTWVIRCDEANA